MILGQIFIDHQQKRIMKKLILHLGGGINRADRAIELANQYPDAKILVSSEGGDVIGYYRDRGISEDRVVHDTSAWDTLTNFTHTLNLVRDVYEADEVYVVTHDFHMRRSMRIANAVYFLRGITPIPSSAGGPDRTELEKYVTQDTYRAWIWRLTGLLFYWKSVREQRTGSGEPQSWNEIPM